MPVIIFEGADGCGKNTLVNSLHHYYTAFGKDVKIFNDGYGELYPQEYYNLIKKPDISNQARFLLLQSIRADLYQSILDYHYNNPEAIILMNRSILSSLVYQFLVNYVTLDSQIIIRDTLSIEARIFSALVDLTIPENFVKILKPSIVYMNVESDISINRDPKMCDWVNSVEYSDFDKLKEREAFLKKIIFCYREIFDMRFCGNITVNNLFNILQSDSNLYKLIFECTQITINANNSKQLVLKEFLEKLGNTYIE